MACRPLKELFHDLSVILFSVDRVLTEYYSFAKRVVDWTWWIGTEGDVTKAWKR